MAWAIQKRRKNSEIYETLKRLASRRAAETALAELRAASPLANYRIRKVR